MSTYQHAPSKDHFLRTRPEAVRSWELSLNIFEERPATRSNENDMESFSLEPPLKGST
jgi:hypothetical protein